MELTLATFFDGGWFGVNGVGPGSGGTLSATEHLVAPIVQVSTDHGTNWTTVPSTNNYVAKLTDHPLPEVDFGPPTPATATFTLTTPQSGVNGVRIIGQEGGTASGGFLGVFDLAVYAGTSTAPTGLTLSKASIVSGQFQFEFQTESGKNYDVQSQTGVGTTWQKLTAVAGDGKVKQVTDKVSDPVRLYRVSSQ